MVSILAGVNADGTANMSLAGHWFQVAQQVSLSSNNTIELSWKTRCPPCPGGGYYVVEVTGGFVNNSIINNTLDLTGKSSTGIQLDGEDYGTRIIGNHFIGGTIYDNVYTGTAISLAPRSSRRPSGNGAFPLPAGWTALPNLGAVIEDNTIQDSLGGIMIGVQHGANYWASDSRHHLRDGACFPDGVRDRATRSSSTRAFSSSLGGRLRRGREQPRREFHSADHHDRQRIQRGSDRGLTAALDFPGPSATP